MANCINSYRMMRLQNITSCATDESGEDYHIRMFYVWSYPKQRKVQDKTCPPVSYYKFRFVRTPCSVIPPMGGTQ